MAKVHLFHYENLLYLLLARVSTFPSYRKQFTNLPNKSEVLVLSKYYILYNAIEMQSRLHFVITTPTYRVPFSHN